MIIKIESVEEKTASTGRKFWTVRADGKSWNVFDPKFKDCVGTNVEVMTKMNGKYENLELVRTNVAPVEVPQTNVGSVVTYSTFKRDVEKIKGTSMSYAKDIVVALTNCGKVTDGADVIKTLDFFYRFFRDTLMENDEEKTEEALLEK